MKQIEITKELYNLPNKENLKFKSKKGISEALVRQISKDKKEPDWILEKRLQGLKLFKKD